MAIGLTDEANYSAIADAIRDKNGSTTTYTPAEMADAIMTIETGSMDGLVVVFTNNDDGTYSCDKTFAEIKESIAAGGIVLCSYLNYIGYLNCHDDDEILFYVHNVLASTDSIFIMNDQEIVQRFNFNATNILPSSVITSKSDNLVIITSTQRDGITSTYSVTLDSNGYPISVSLGSNTCTLTWEGFE